MTVLLWASATILKGFYAHFESLRTLLCVVALVCMAMAVDQTLGIRDSYRLSFSVPIRVGTTVSPAGECKIRHTMEGQEHVMGGKSRTRDDHL